MTRASHRGGCIGGLITIGALFLLMFIVYQFAKHAG